MHVNFLCYSCKLFFTKMDCTLKSTIHFLTVISFTCLCIDPSTIYIKHFHHFLFTFSSYYKDTIASATLLNLYVYS